MQIIKFINKNCISCCQRCYTLIINFYLIKRLLQLFKYNWNNINLNKNGRSTLLTSLLVGVSGVPLR